MDAADNTGKARTPQQAPGTNHDTAMTASSAATDRRFGPDGATILATEHWSLLGTRSMIWNEAMSRTTVFLTVLSASIVALALLANATGFGRRTTTVALVLLSVVFLLGLATYGRLVQINSEDVAITLAMNRLRYAYLVMAPDLRPYFSTGHHDDERGLATTYMLGRSSVPTWPHFLVTTPTLVATVDTAVATAIVVLAGLTQRGPSRPPPAPSWPPQWSHSCAPGERCSPSNGSTCGCCAKPTYAFPPQQTNPEPAIGRPASDQSSAPAHHDH